ncbi:MAG: NAD(+)/NADH kinase, partial [Spirochaetales bacterium]
FGFIAGIKSNQWKTALHDFLENKIIPEKRSLLCAEVFRNKKSVHTEHALNDIVVTSKKTMQTIRLNVEANEIPFGKFKADGMIIATSTGSTAYSLAAGGPIVDPALDTIIFNPVSAFSLSVRPLVLPGETILKITVLPSRNYDFMLSCDGQVHADIEEGDCIVIKQSPYKALLVGCSADVFYEALRSKLHWSGGLFA